MTPDEHALLERVSAMVSENNDILRSIRRGNRFNTLIHIIYWVIIIGASVAAYYYLQPYITKATNLYNQAQQQMQQIQSGLNSAESTVNSVRGALNGITK